MDYLKPLYSREITNGARNIYDGAPSPFFKRAYHTVDAVDGVRQQTIKNKSKHVYTKADQN